MTDVNLWGGHSAEPYMSTPVWGCVRTVAPIPLGIPRAGIPKGIAKAVFALYHRPSRAEPASQPPPPNKLYEGGWEVEGEVVVKEKNVEEKTKEKKQSRRSKAEEARARRSGFRGPIRWCN